MEERQTGSDTTSLASAALSSDNPTYEAFAAWYQGRFKRALIPGSTVAQTMFATWKAACEWAAAHITPEPGADCFEGELRFSGESIHIDVHWDHQVNELLAMADGTRFHCFPILERGENSNG